MSLTHPSDNNLRVHAVLHRSRVNGPGERMVIWTQGCAKGCPGCFNPETWSFSRGRQTDVRLLAAEVLASGAEGLTITGGDPFEQPFALLLFLLALHESDDTLSSLPLGVICFTGYTLEEIEDFEGAAGEAMRACLPMIDLLVDGRYVEALRRDSHLAGSCNQRFHFSSVAGRGEARISRESVAGDHEVEIHVSEDGGLQVTGFPVVDRARFARMGVRVLPLASE